MMGETEAVRRVVFEARQFARPDSNVDEQEWFDAGEPDTEPVTLVDRPEVVYPARPAFEQRRRGWGYVVAAGAFAIIAIGLAIGYRLGTV